ncbi:MAG: hypothetical protein IPK68_16820 [Bdellovibrionales bacterium]|nr:hypothetical protein [Bdellovibrionales bacterium]
MKILVVSLLRIGDVLMALPMLQGLRQAHPGAEIHLLVNTTASSLAPLVDFVRWHYFDRSNLQLGLGDYDHSLFDSFHKLSATVDNLNQHSFDLLINVTQNRLSGWLCSAIHARDKIGLIIDRNGRGDTGPPGLTISMIVLERKTWNRFITVTCFPTELGLNQ